MYNTRNYTAYLTFHKELVKSVRSGTIGMRLSIGEMGHRVTHVGESITVTGLAGDHYFMEQTGIRSDTALDARRLRLLYRATLALHSTLDSSEVIEAVLRETQDLLQADIVSLWRLDQSAGELICRHCVGYPSQRLLGLRVPQDTSLLGWSIKHGETVYVPDLTQDPRYNPLISQHGRIDPHSLIASPIHMVRTHDAVIGALVIVDDAIDAFTPADIALADGLARSAAIAIENAWLYSRAQTELEERRRTQQALQQSEAYYRTLVETSPDGILTLDPDGRITAVNPRGLALLGYENRLDVLGKDCFAFLTPEERPAAYQAFRNTLSGRTTRDYVTTILRNDGTTFAAECSASLMTEVTGEPYGIVVFFRDITARKEAEASQQRYVEELQLLNRIATRISQVPDVSFIVRTALEEALSGLHFDAGWVMMVQDQQPAISSRSESVLQQGMEVLAARTEQASPDPVRRLQRQIHAEVVRRQSPVVRLADDLGLNASPVEVIAIPLKTTGMVAGTLALLGIRDGHPEGFTEADIQLLTNIGHQVAIAIENAHLSRAAAEVDMLRELDRLRRELISNVSHNLKTPLGVIKFSCTTLLRDDTVFDETVRRELLESIDEQVDQLTAMINRILDASRSEQSLARPCRQPVDLAEVARSVVRMLDNPLSRHNLILDFEPPDIVVYANVQHIKDVLLNLLDNAMKYSPSGGNILIQGRLQQGRALVKIIDHGIGIPEDDIPWVFERFYRGHNVRESKMTGVGLGLSVVRDIVTAHHGRIWLELTPGGGTTVSFTLPLALEHLLSPESKFSHSTPDTSSGSQGQK